MSNAVSAPATETGAIRSFGLFAALVATVLAAAIGLFAATSASAYSVSSSGSPGVTSTPFTYGDYDAWTRGSTITVNWRTVYESTAYSRYDQYVCVNPS
jgi:hypothetical protein